MLSALNFAVLRLMCEFLRLVAVYSVGPYMCWSLANSPDRCSFLSMQNSKLSDWTEDDLSETGKWVYNRFISEKKKNR